MKKLLVIIALFLIGLFGYGQNYIQALYFTSRNSEGGGGHKVILNEDPPVIQNFEPFYTDRPYGIAVDSANSFVYITDYYQGVIFRFNTDGEDPEKILDVSVPGQEIVGSPEAIFVYEDKIYWGSVGGIFRANLDGTDPEEFINTGGQPPEFPIDMQYDPVSDKIYLVNDKYDYSGGLWVVNFDGTGLTELIPDIDGTAIEVDFQGGKIYLAAYEAPGTPIPDYGIYKCNLDGTNIIKIGDYGDKAAWGLAIDHQQNKIFWSYKMSNTGADGKIIRANLDGSGQEDWLTDVNPNAITVSWIKEENVGTSIPPSAILHVYPNPAIDQLILRGDFYDARLILYSSDGSVVYTSDNESKQATIDVSSLHRGLYILRIETSGSTIFHKVALTR